MSRKHFSAIAHALRVERPEGGPSLATWERLVRTMADTLYAFNGRFDRGRFYAACGYEA